MTNTEILYAVKVGLKELSDYNDEEIMLWIKASIKFLKNAGVKDSQIESGEALGVITLCVNSLRLREPNFSPITMMMATQLALSGD